MASMTTACLFPGGGETDPTAPPGWEVGGDNQPAIEAIFVGGHLGNYLDCPDDGYSEPGGSSDEPSSSRDADFAACEPSEDGDESNCGGPLNCEQAQITIKLVNNGDAKALGLSIERIALTDANGAVVATLPLIAAIDTASGEAFDGELAAGAEVTLRLDYQGPTDIEQFLPSQSRWDGSAILELTFGADNHPNVVIETKAVSVLPSVVT